MPKETKDGKTKAPKEPVTEVPSEVAAENGAGGAAKARTAIDDVIAAIEGARDKVMADEVKALTKLGIPRAMAYQMVAARFHQNVVTDGEGGGPEFENSAEASTPINPGVTTRPAVASRSPRCRSLPAARKLVPAATGTRTSTVP